MKHIITHKNALETDSLQANLLFSCKVCKNIGCDLSSQFVL